MCSLRGVLIPILPWVLVIALQAMGIVGLGHMLSRPGTRVDDSVPA